MMRPLLIIMLATLICGCKNTVTYPNQTTDTGVSGGVVGKWYVKAITTFSSSGTLTNTAFTAQDYFLFNTGTTVNISQSTPAISSALNYTYVSDTSGERITFTNTDKTNVYTVYKLTADSLVISGSTAVTGGATVGLIAITYKIAHK